VEKDPLTEEERQLILDYKEKQRKIYSMQQYLTEKYANERLISLVPFIVHTSAFYDIDPFRVLSIIILETGFGYSDAFVYQNNICGMNWTEEQKRKIGIQSDIYNVAVEKTLEASITNLVQLLVEYRDVGDTPLVTLAEIQTIYAPVSDHREGLDGMNNNEWLLNVTTHFNNIRSIYLKGDDLNGRITKQRTEVC